MLHRSPLLLLAVLAAGCVSSPSPAPDEPSRSFDGVQLSVDGEERDTSTAQLQLCSERLPETVELLVWTERPTCPELRADGPAGLERSMGHRCETLQLRLTATGEATFVAYSRQEPPVLFLSSDGSGESSARTEVIVNRLERNEDGSYRVEIAAHLDGASEVRASVAITLAPTFCTSA